MIFFSSGNLAAPDFSEITDFMWDFEQIFLHPLFNILNETEVLGFPLFNWLFGLTILSVAVRFISALWGLDRK